MLKVTLYRRADCPSCDQVAAELDQLRNEIPHELSVVTIDSIRTLEERYGDQVPVVQISPYRLQGTISPVELRVALSAAAERHQQKLEDGSPAVQSSPERRKALDRIDRLGSWIGHHYMFVINLFLFIYVGLPVLAPVLAKAGYAVPARAIYTLYSPLCHQLSFRSWFMFGQQPAYPLELAGVESLLSYEQVIAAGEPDLAFARSFIGNEQVGFKMALCERDVAIWGSMLLFGLLFALSGRRLRGIPWYVWIIFGIIPIGLDGSSQLPAFLEGILEWFPSRESTPLLRTITGALFGITTAWFLFPMMEDGMKDTRVVIEERRAVYAQGRQDKE